MRPEVEGKNTLILFAAVREKALPLLTSNWLFISEIPSVKFQDFVLQ